MLMSRVFAGLLVGGLMVFTCQTLQAEDGLEELIGPSLKMATAPRSDATDSFEKAGQRTIMTSLVPDAPEWMMTNLVIHVPLSDPLGHMGHASLIVTVSSEGRIQVQGLRDPAACTSPLGLDISQSAGDEVLRKPLLLTSDGWALAR